MQIIGIANTAIFLANFFSSRCLLIQLVTLFILLLGGVRAIRANIPY